jgi:hypothetical protein
MPSRARSRRSTAPSAADCRRATACPPRSSSAGCANDSKLARDATATSGAVDVEVIGTLVRDVAAWYPEDQVQLLVALGAIVQAAARG